jgi:hypothetical protein
MTIASNLGGQGVAAIAASALVSFAPPATAQRLASWRPARESDASSGALPRAE